jgi:uncharacterized membrane protein
MMIRPAITNAFAIVILLLAKAPAAEIVPIPLGGFVRMSDDGQWFLGTHGDEAAIWSSVHGLNRLGISKLSAVWGISDDGSVVVGSTVVDETIINRPRFEPFLWTRVGGIVGLGSLPGFTSSQAMAVSGDGSTVLGSSTVHLNENPNEGRMPWTWTKDAGMVVLGLPPGATGATGLGAISKDGSVVLGSAVVGGVGQAFVWERRDGFQLLPPGTDGRRISADGSTVVGNLVPRPSRPYRWTLENGMNILPAPAGMASGFTNDLTWDGSIIVGNLTPGVIPVDPRAYVWDEQHGAQDLRDLLIREHGFFDQDLPTLYNAYEISADLMTLTVTTNFNPGSPAAIYLDKPLVTVVPEPSTTLLGCTGVLALFVALRWRRSLSRKRLLL